MAEAPSAGRAGGQQETRDGPHLRPSFLLSERPPVAGGGGKDAGCQTDRPPGSGQQVFHGRPEASGIRAGTTSKAFGQQITHSAGQRDDKKPAAICLTHGPHPRAAGERREMNTGSAGAAIGSMVPDRSRPVVPSSSSSLAEASL